MGRRDLVVDRVELSWVVGERERESWGRWRIQRFWHPRKARAGLMRMPSLQWTSSSHHWLTRHHVTLSPGCRIGLCIFSLFSHASRWVSHFTFHISICEVCTNWINFEREPHVTQVFEFQFLSAIFLLRRFTFPSHLSWLSNQFAVVTSSLYLNPCA